MFVDKQSGKGAEQLPGAGLEVDLERRVCPECGRESPPWETRCGDCDVATVAPDQAPAQQWRLPHLEDDLDDEADPGDLPPGTGGDDGDERD